MNTHTHKIAFALLTGLAALTFVASPAAAQQKQLLLSPGGNHGFVPQPHLPQFGFASFNIHGVGERVSHVRRAGLAARFGLEPGDIVLSMNGVPLTYRGSWNDALYNAMANHGGWVRLKIRDVRTGFIAQRQLFVGHHHGPDEHFHNGGNQNHFGTPGPITLKSKFGGSFGNRSTKSSNKIVELTN